MSEETQGRMQYALGGAVLGGLLGYFFKIFTDPEDEERPPIIVKNGSLIFESGDADSPDQNERRGKHWERTDLQWQPQHRRGRKTKWFVVEIEPPTGGCPACSLTERITLFYGNKPFVLSMENRGGGKGSKAPTITVQYVDDLEALYTTGDNPQLAHDLGGAGTISRVEFVTRKGDRVSCNSPTKLTIWQF